MRKKIIPPRKKHGIPTSSGHVLDVKKKEPYRKKDLWNPEESLGHGPTVSVKIDHIAENKYGIPRSSGYKGPRHSKKIFRPKSAITGDHSKTLW